MLKEKMYVRCPADIESRTDPRVFICGQIEKVDDFNQTLTIKIHDPFNYLLFYENLPKGEVTVPIDMVSRCNFFIGSDVIVKESVCKILSMRKGEDSYYYYYVQDKKNKTVFKACERDIIAAFTNGRVDPASQLQKYELQNPCWYMGRTVVSRSVNILENSIYGFKELAGSKIYLLPHQINTIMRCLQENPCRYMLADEVGMGKTIEAISILKIFMQNRSNVRILIVVPETLKEQWKTELLLKFNIAAGLGPDNNRVVIKSAEQLSTLEFTFAWDFVIVDEVHRYLPVKEIYRKLHTVSTKAKNILLLSATPVQQRREEYLDLLRLLQPEKYDDYSIERFSQLVEKQSNIIQKTALILDDLSDFEEEMNEVLSEDDDPHDSEDCEDLYEEIHERLEAICDDLNDASLNALFDQINFEDNDLGIYRIKVIISYICSNYQIESNIIRNRRKLLESDDDGDRLMPTRELKTATYSLDKDRNIYEALCYQMLTDWITSHTEDLNVEGTVHPLLTAFFSSSWAFRTQLLKLESTECEPIPELMDTVDKWISAEDDILLNIRSILNDPDTHSEEYSTRLVTIFNLISEELYNQKIVLFTNYKETFQAYRTALENVFKADEISFFGADMPPSEIELNAYRFQNEQSCRIMLCDYTGGEGRNFQCADYIVHIDLPWDANMIEQRIGRLDRLERDPSRPVVHSVVVYAEDTFENALFDFWSKGLKIFNQSLSGMEIIMKDINQEIVSAIQDDFQYGLFDRVPKIIQLADEMREVVRKEQNFDAAAFIFRPMYTELRRLIDYYSHNENALFAETMTNWASLAGFHGFTTDDGIVTYTASSFSPRSAINSQLIPPRWNDYLSGDQNKFVNSVEAAYRKSKSVQVSDSAIRGTFIRKQAIENDYLHFFAPGDDIFDCIVNNAMNSCRGQSSAFASPANINWRGFIFTWSVAPNEEYLLDHDISIYALSPYRNYLMTNQIIVPISLMNTDSYSDEQIIREYTRLINEGFVKSRTVHLGKRSHDPGFLKNIVSLANIDWFKEWYPEDKWNDLVAYARKVSHDKVASEFKHRANIRGARDEMERMLSAKAANSQFYGLNDEMLEKLKHEQHYVLEALRHPKVTLDSAAFVWMVNTQNGSKNH